MNFNQIKSLLLITIIIIGCSSENNTNKTSAPTGELFQAVAAAHSKVLFKNEVAETMEFNFIRYSYIYNGGGVALGDINNDGLVDIYLSSNQSTNKLYLNKGGFEFEDITVNAGVADQDGWTTGISMIDINNDGYLDIYVCKSASINNNEARQNKLFINQKNNSFKELARAYGLNDMAYSTQAYFFDYDKDGDNDMYLVNHRVDFENNIKIDMSQQNKTSLLTTDKLYRNDNGHFSDVTQSAGLLNNTWGLSASIADYNDDGWPDIYVCNDFILGDQLWVNNKNGGFTNEILTIMDHTSFFSMGSDVADINNDSKPDLVILDMVSEDHIANKKNMAAMSTRQFNQLVDLGHHYQYMSNVLQLNRGNGIFSDMALTAGIANTDWSWTPLLADFDNDGLKDLFVTNGIKRDMTDNDYKIALDKRSAQGKVTLEDVFSLIPSRKIKNYIYKNNGNIGFEKKTDEWGFGQYLNSNGAAYGDLDNDGDLDLVTNNLDDYASIYENLSGSNYVKFKIIGPPQNTMGLGVSLRLTYSSGIQHNEYYVNRGFLSSVAPDIIMGLGNDKNAGPLEVIWPDGKYQIIEKIQANQTISIDYVNATRSNIQHEKPKPIVTKPENLKYNLAFGHKENSYDDFINEILLPHKYSTLGPSTSHGDVNGDGKEDVFVSGARGQASQLFIQQENGQFKNTNQQLFDKYKSQENLGSCFLDGDNDGDLDLYVVSGGNESPDLDAIYEDRYFLNDGSGNFSSSNNIPKIYSSGKTVVSGDYDADGDMDLLICGRIVPGKYPLPASSTLLQNNGGKFIDVTNEIAPELTALGLVTDALFSDYDADGDLDILFVGEWMALTLFVNENNQFTKKSLESETGSGWWYSISQGDLDKDGNMDYVLGNLGRNNKFGANEEKPFHVFCSDFDDSGNLDIVLSKEKQGKFLPVRGRECSSQQMPFIKEKFPTFKSFAEADLAHIYGQDKLSNAVHFVANNFESIVLMNLGNGSVESKALPIEAQFGPTLCLEILDINKDGHLDIVGAGNIYNSEVETLRYDASKGYILLGDGKGSFNYLPESGLLLEGDVKDLDIIEVLGKKLIIVSKNNGPIEILELL